MKNIPSKINPAMRKVQATQQIKSFYRKEYSTFMGCFDLPDFDVRFFDGRKVKGAKEAWVEVPNKKTSYKYIFNVEEILAMYLGENKEHLLFHEFTHVYDHAKRLFDMNDDAKAEYLNLFSEFHATYVEMLIASGCNSYVDGKKIKLSDMLSIDSFSSKSTTLYEHICKCTNDYQDWSFSFVRQ